MRTADHPANDDHCQNHGDQTSDNKDRGRQTARSFTTARVNARNLRHIGFESIAVDGGWSAIN